LFRKVRVLAYDPASDLLLTEPDLDAAIRYMIFERQLQGLPVTTTPKQVAQFKKQTAAQFSRLRWRPGSSSAAPASCGWSCR